MSFMNKVVLVTGASSGIGAATAVLFSKEGAKVAMVGRNEARLKTVADTCAKAGNAPLVIVADLAKEEDTERVVKETIDKYEKLDVLVNNAGLGVLGNITDGKILKAYDDILRVNMRAVIQLTVLARPYLVKTKGNIVNISSVLGKTARLESNVAYSISKAGIDIFTRGAAKELAPAGIRVNGVSPGPVKTNFFDSAGMDVTSESIGNETLLKRASEADEIAQLIMYLASEKAIGITGSDFVADNGYLAS